MKEVKNIKGLPQGWKVERLGDVCEVVTGTTPPKSDPSNYGGEIPFFKPPHLWDRVIVDTDEKISAKGAKKARVIPANTVLVTCIGNLGRTGLTKKEAAFNQQLNAILENQKIIGKYIFYQAQSPLFKRQLERLATGTTVSIVNKGNFETINIPIPPKEIQQQIVSKIEELFSELDNGIEELKTAQQQLKVYRQAVLKWAFEGRLTNGDVKDGELPEGWKCIQLKKVCITILGGGTPSTSKSEYWEGDIPWISSADILGIKNLKPRRKISADAVKNSTTNILPKGGIVVVTRVGLGKLAVAPFDLCFSQDSQGLILNHELISTEYALLVLHKEVQVFKHQSRGTTIKGVTKKQLEELVISLPPLKEQSHIVKEIESRLSICDKIEETINNSLKQTQALRQSILKKAFEGKF